MEKRLESKPPPVQALSMSLPGNVRIGPILAIPALLSESGVSPQRAFAQAGIDPRLFDNPDNRVPIEAVGRLFAIHERTLRRRLEKERKNLQQLVNEARFELAQQLLQNTCLSVSAIATALRYDDANAFSRAFRNWANLSPTQWRARQ